MDTIPQGMGGDLAKGLSERQAECLRLAAQGYTSKQIARAIGISPSTVDNHISAAVDRLGARNRIDAARFMLREASSESEVLLVKDRSAPPRMPRAPLRALLALPPLGGPPNALGRRRRLLHILQIATLATAVTSGIILTIAGVVYVLA